MSSHGPGVSTSQAAQKRSIIEVLHELQRQIQAYGQGPFTSEQAKELDKLKILYMKAKQQYDKQVKLLQSSAMTNQPTSIQATLPTAGTPLPIPSTQAVGITSVPSPQQMIKGQQAHIIHQLQSRNPASVSNLSTTHAAINAHVLGQQSLQIVGSVSNLISSSGTLAIVSTPVGQGKSQVVYTTPNKNQIVSRAHAQIRPTLPAVNVAAHTIAAGVSSLTAQQQLRMMGITTNQRPEVHGMQQVVPTVKQPTATPAATNPQSVQVLSRRKLQDLLHEIDARETMDEDVEELLLQMADDFIENVVGSACQLAKHRKSNTLELKDIQLHLDRHWNMWVPGFGNEDLRPHKKVATADAHRQRMAIIKKSLKK